MYVKETCTASQLAFYTCPCNRFFGEFDKGNIRWDSIALKLRTPLEMKNLDNQSPLAATIAAAAAAAAGITNVFVVVEKVSLFRIVPNSEFGRFSAAAAAATSDDFSRDLKFRGMRKMHQSMLELNARAAMQI